MGILGGGLLFWHHLRRRWGWVNSRSGPENPLHSSANFYSIASGERIRKRPTVPFPIATEPMPCPTGRIRGFGIPARVENILSAVRRPVRGTPTHASGQTGIRGRSLGKSMPNALSSCNLHDSTKASIIYGCAAQGNGESPRPTIVIRQTVRVHASSGYVAGVPSRSTLYYGGYI